MKRVFKSLLLFLAIAIFITSALAKGGKTELTWYGHAAFKIVTPQGHVLFIDPWLKNPLNPNGQKDLDNIAKADLILVSHGHFDHVGSATEIAKKTQAKLVTTYDLGNAISAYGGYPKEQAGLDSLGNFGGTLTFLNGDVSILFVPAVHSSGLNPKDLGVGEDHPEFAGNPGGFVIKIKDGPTFYHTGDTDVYNDMARIGKNQKIDVMLTCIGDHFTMGPNGAAEAVSLVRPNIIIPMHYQTFPIIPGNVDTFKLALKKYHLEKQLQPIEVKKPVYF